MTIPSFARHWKGGELAAPDIHILEVRKPGTPVADPVAWLLVERRESLRRDERDNSVFEAAIELSFEPLASKHERGRAAPASFVASYHAIGSDGPWISLTSHSYGSGAVFLDPAGLRGHRIGTFLMNEIVLWARQWPNATVSPIELLDGQAYEHNRARRNRFYERFGLRFDYRDDEQREGVSRPMPAGLLTPVETWKENLRVLQVDAFLGELLHERNELASEARHRQAALTALTRELGEASSRPVRWAGGRIWERHRVVILSAAILGLIAAVFWQG